MKRRLTVSLSFLLAVAAPASADELLGVPLPAPRIVSVTGGCYPAPCSPGNVNTWLTPFVASEAGVVKTWRAQFLSGRLGFSCLIPTRVQLKVLRMTSPTTAQVVAAGAVHDPKAIFEAQRGSCPSLQLGSETSMIEFTEAGVQMAAGDRLGLAIGAEANVGVYLSPFVRTGQISRSAVRDVAVGDAIDLASIYTGTSLLVPAMQGLVEPLVLDSDGDGLLDTVDACPASPPGAVVDASGCAIDDYCPCASSSWRNHGAYVSCVSHAADAMLLAGVIDEAQKDAAVSAAGASRCGAEGAMGRPGNNGRSGR